MSSVPYILCSALYLTRTGADLVLAGCAVTAPTASLDQQTMIYPLRYPQAFGFFPAFLTVHAVNVVVSGCVHTRFSRGSKQWLLGQQKCTSLPLPENARLLSRLCCRPVPQQQMRTPARPVQGSESDLAVFTTLWGTNLHLFVVLTCVP